MPETALKGGNTVNLRRIAAALADTAPVVVLAAIAGAGSFTHIRDTAAQHGQGGPMSWAIAVCIDFSELAVRRDLPVY
jgi:isopentenyl phosphate kinase